jgi:hypothetical protein
MHAIRNVGAAIVAVALLAGLAAAQTPSPPPSTGPGAQERFDAAKDLYTKDMGYYGDAVVKLRDANAHPGGSMSCSYADLIVVSLASAQDQLKIMIDLIEAAHQDAIPYRRDYDDNAAQLVLRKASFKKGCS